MAKRSPSRFLVIAFSALLIVGGALFAVRYAKRSFAAYRALDFARHHNFDAGDLDVDLIQNWMSIRYIAVAYTVPQSYLFDQIGIEMNPPNSALPLERLNNHHRFGAIDGQPAILATIGNAIERYRQNPVVTGLQERRVHRWMSVQYIAVSTGIPAEDIFDQLGLSPDGNTYLPLDSLSREIRYPSGTRGLVERIQDIVDSSTASPP